MSRVIFAYVNRFVTQKKKREIKRKQLSPFWWITVYFSNTHDCMRETYIAREKKKQINTWHILTTVKTFLRSCWNAVTSKPGALSANFLKFSANGPDNACNWRHDCAYCLRTNSIIVDVNAKPINMYNVQNSI